MTSDNQLLIFIFQALILFSILGSLFLCKNHRNACQIYWHFGKNMAAAYAMIELVTLLVRGATLGASTVFVFHFITISLSITVGMFLARQMHQFSLPLALSLTGTRQGKFSIPWSKYLLRIVIYALVTCAFTVVLFRTTHPELSQYLKESIAADSPSVRNHVAFTSIIFFILVAFYEEVVFRLFIQNLLMHLLRKFSWAGSAAILGSSLFFAFGHFGILASWWVKFTQTFVMGLLLGHLMKKQGMEASFLMHSLINIFALYSSDLLMNV